ncbi:hypothetical protein WME75_28210 [Sorangium sp. So ce1014]|uniref:hypothetical protein n=1 Tax=Sorangium sp. So ce1014 TaxID=3133326 RepID=UPI003F63943E
MKTARKSTLASALVTSCLVGASVIGCGAGATQDDFEVTSNSQAGLLARVDYDEGGYVEFLRDEEGGIFIGSVFEKTGFDPLRGIQLGRVLPSELFTHLTNREAPADLIAAEREAALLSSPEALATREQPSDARALGPSGAENLGTASSAMSESEFASRHCPAGIDFCGLGVTGNQNVNSDGRVKKAEGDVDVLAGSLRLRVIRNRLVGGDETLGTYLGNAGFQVHFSNATPGLKRTMRVVVDRAESATYHLAVNFSG